MPIYQVDDGRPIPVDPSRTPVPNAAGVHAAFAPQGAALLGDDLGALLGEQLLPVATRPPDHDGPYLLAVDAAVHAVVIEIIHRLDDEALVAAMDYARMAERWTYRDIAAVYHAGEEHFERDLEAFRRTIPASALAAAFRNVGSRLLLVCTELAPEVLPALRFLLESEHPIEVLQISMLSSGDGRSYVDVSPITRQVIEEREQEVAPQRRAAPLDAPLTAPVSRPAARTSHAPSAPVRAAHRPGDWSGQERRVAQRPWYGKERRSVDAGGRTLLQTGSRVALAQGAGEGPGAAWDDPLTPAAGVGLAPETLPAGALAAGWSSPGALALAELARAIHTPATLVWDRRRRGQRFEAMLLSNGSILLQDGSAHADPDQAATAVCGADSIVDGWRVWRLGSGGPTLAEVLDH